MRQKYAVFKILFSVSILAMLIFFQDTAFGERLQKTVFSLLRPLMHIASIPWFSDGEQDLNSRVQESVKAEIFETAALKEENERLKKALRIKEGKGFSLIGARVILYASEFGKEFMLIDQGKENGISEGMAMLDEHGVILGVVREVHQTFANVSIASNKGEAFDAAAVPIGTTALARGLGSRSFSIELIPQGVPIRQGDFIEIRISGISSRFLLAEIVRFLPSSASAFQDMHAVLISDPAKAKNVFIVIPLP